MKFSPVRTFALSLPEVTEEPHHQFSSFRVRGKIFVTVPPQQEYIHVFVSEQQREQALAMYPSFTEKLLWGGKAVGVRVALAGADPQAVKSLVRSAWQTKSAKGLAAIRSIARGQLSGPTCCITTIRDTHHDDPHSARFDPDPESAV